MIPLLARTTAMPPGSILPAELHLGSLDLWWECGRQHGAGAAGRSLVDGSGRRGGKSDAVGTTAWITGRYGRYIELSAASPRVSSTLVMGSQYLSGTVLLLMRQRSVATAPIIGDWYPTKNNGTMCFRSLTGGGPRYQLELEGSGGTATVNSPNASAVYDAWILLGACWGPLGAQIWLNGQQIAGNSNAKDGTLGTQGVTINTDDGSRYADADYAFVGVWHSQLGLGSAMRAIQRTLPRGVV